MKSVLKQYKELSRDELYAIMHIRQEVFIVEQDCPYLDADYKDQRCHHYYYVDNNDKIVAYVRLVPETVSYPKHCSIGRVVVSPSSRLQKLGIKIMRESIDLCKSLYPSIPIKISGQQYLERFYSNLGFNTVSEPYLEDNIPHVAMVYEV